MKYPTPGTDIQDHQADQQLTFCSEERLHRQCDSKRLEVLLHMGCALC